MGFLARAGAALGRLVASFGYGSPQDRRQVPYYLEQPPAIVLFQPPAVEVTVLPMRLRPVLWITSESPTQPSVVLPTIIGGL